MSYGAALATIAALVMSVFAALPASAFACESWCGGGGETNTDNSVYISVSNSGSINSDTDAKASTGGNWAGGSEGGDGAKGGKGGSGGDAGNDDGCGECWSGGSGDANGGDGGNGGNGGSGSNGGAGGLVDTGNAEANAGSLNVLNSTDIEVQAADCGCGDNDHHQHGWSRGGDRNTDNSVDVYVTNSGSIYSDTDAKATTGKNDAEGSSGGDGAKGGKGGSGGDAEGGDGFWEYDSYYGSSSNAGNGGDGGEGGEGGSGDVGGTIRTGRAEANAGSINVMNSTIVRVTR